MLFSVTFAEDTQHSVHRLAQALWKWWQKLFRELIKQLILKERQ